MKADKNIVDSIIERSAKTVSARVYQQLMSDLQYSELAAKYLEAGGTPSDTERVLLGEMTENLFASNVVTFRRKA